MCQFSKHCLLKIEMHWEKYKTGLKYRLDHIWANCLTISTMGATQILNSWLVLVIKNPCCHPIFYCIQQNSSELLSNISSSKTKRTNGKNICDIKYEIKVNRDRKDMSNVCKNNPETVVKDNGSELFSINNSDKSCPNGLERSKIKIQTTDKQTSREFWRVKEIAWCSDISITVIWYYNFSMCLVDCPWYLATENW